MANRISIRPAAIALAGVIAIASAMPADAGHRHRHGGYGNGGDLLAAGIAGAVIGSIIAAPRPVYVEPYPVYVEPRPVYIEPQPVYIQPQPVYIEPQPVYIQPRQPRPVAIQPRYAEPVAIQPNYGRHERRSLDQYESGPRVVTYEDTVGSVRHAGGYEPWSAGWLDYCRGKFRSFDERTGTYLGYDGDRHFCVVK